MSQKGGYPQWFDNVPKGMSHKRYLKLKKSKPKNKTMKVWIKENKKKKTVRKKKKTIQHGGILPCLPCVAGPAATALGLSTAGYMVTRSSSSSTINGKKTIKRREEYKIKKNGKWIKKVFVQKGKKIYLNGKLIKKKIRSINHASKILDQKIRECIKSGFKRC